MGPEDRVESAAASDDCLEDQAGKVRVSSSKGEEGGSEGLELS